MGMDSDITTTDNDEKVKEKSKSVNIENMVIYSSYEVLEDGTRIFSAED